MPPGFNYAHVAGLFTHTPHDAPCIFQKLQKLTHDQIMCFKKQLMLGGAWRDLL